MGYSRTTNKGNVIMMADLSPEIIAEAATFGIDVVAEAKAAVDQEVERQNKEKSMNATMYTKSPCPYCDRAKMLFKHKGVTVTEISAVENMDEMTQKVTEATGNAPKTVPQIWLEGQYIGGFQELVEHYKQNP